MIAFNKIGFHGGPAGNHNGIGDYMRRLDAAGIPFVMKSVDHYGHCFEAAQYTNAEHVVVFRLSTHGQPTGYDYDVPPYDMSPRDAAHWHWQHTVTQLPPEFDKRKVWLELINEVDKDQSDWLGHFAAEIGQLANTAGYKVLLFGWSAGEPEVAHWHTTGMKRYLTLCAQRPDKLGVSLHEYSYVLDDIWRGDGNLIGRFQQLFAVCDELGLPHPTTVITEWGWTLNNIPSVSRSMQDIAQVVALYAQYPAIKGAAIWYLGGDFGSIHNQTQKLIAPVTEYSLTARFNVDDPGEPPVVPPPVIIPPESDNRLTNGNFSDGWEDVNYNGLINQRPEGWALACALPGEEAFGAINHKTGELARATAVPEAIHKLNKQLPPDEQLGGADALILSGTAVYKIFAANNAFAARLGQVVRNLEPGAAVQAVVPVRVHYHDALNEPDDVEVWVEVNGKKTTVWAKDLPHRTWVHVQADGTADEYGEVVIVVTVVTKWRNTRDFFLDDLRLTVLEDAPIEPPVEPPPVIIPPAPTPYPAETTHVILRPKDITAAQLEFLRGVMAVGFDGIVPGFEGWAHTTAINAVSTAVSNGFTDSRLIVMDGEQIGTGLDEVWMQANQPALLPYTLFVSSTPVEPEPEPETPAGIIEIDPVWQCAPKWKAQPCGTGPKTLCQWGCLLTAYHMMATHWDINDGRDLLAENAYYVQHGGFSGHNLVSMAMSKVYPSVKNEGWMTRDNPQMRVKAKSYLDRGIPVPARVDFKPATPQWEQHWVLLVGYDGEDFYMNDPWTGLEAVKVNDYYGIVGSDILECIFYLPPGEAPSPPPVVGKAAFGLHADTRGGVLTQTEVGVFSEARVDMVKVLSSTAPQSIAELSRALGRVKWVVRAFLRFDNGRVVTPQQFFEWTIDDVTRTLNAIPDEDEVVVELHNEPNLTTEGLGGSWADGAGFNSWYTTVLALYRQRLGNVRFIFPGLSPGGYIPDLRQDHRAFMRSCASAIAASDGVGVHCYWSAGYPMRGHPDAGVSLLKETVAAVKGKPVWVTEASRNDGGVSLNTRADEYVDFWRECRAITAVQGVTYYVASAAPGEFPHEVWIEGGKSTGLSRLVGAR